MKTKLKLSTILLYCYLLYLFIGIVLSPYNHSTPNGIAGFANLSDCSFDNESTYSIGGLLQEDERYSNDDYVCYSLNALLPDKLGRVSLLIPFVYTSTCVYVNDYPVYVCTQKSDYFLSPPQIISFPIDNRMIRVRIYASRTDAESANYYNSVLFHPSLSIGSDYAVSTDYVNKLFFSVSQAIIALLCAFFQLGISIRNSKGSVHRYLSATCFAVFITIIFRNYNLISYIFPRISVYNSFRAISISYMLTILFFFLYTEKLAHAKMHPIIKRSFLIMCYVFILAILILPMRVGFHIHFAFLLLAYAVVLFCLVFYVMNARHDSRRNNKQSETVGFFAILIGSFSDIYQFSMIGASTSVMPLMTMIYTFVQCITMSIHYDNVNTDVGKLTPLLNKAMDEIHNDKSTYINAHIKPVFLYETLDSIAYYTDHDLKKVNSLIQNFSKYLRQSLDFSINPDNYSLRKEITNSKAFAALVMEQINNLNIIFEIEDKLPDTFVPQSSILSLIQNAIDTGFAPSVVPTITIKVFTSSDTTITAQVIDNGVGMTKSNITFAMSQPGSDFGVGLYYINQKLIASGSKGLIIESNKKTGTTISFTRLIEDTSEVYPYDI